MPPHIVDFRQPKNFAEVAKFLGLDVASLQGALDAGRSPDVRPTVYVRHRIPKRNRATGQYRVVWDVQDAHLRDKHRAFAWKFADFAKEVVPNFPYPLTYGYVRNRGIKKNAARHLGAPLLLRCDIKDFFPSISKNRLVSRFIQMGINFIAAEILASFATIEERLALGLNASPMLANLICSELDAKIDALATQYGCIYTRYADDIAISGRALPATGRVAEIVDSEGFTLARKKQRITKLGQAHYVTGLSISDPNGPHVPRLFKRRLRQELYYCRRFGIREHLTKIDADGSYQKGINRIDGTVRFVSSIESRVAEQLRRQWNEALVAESASVSYAPVHDKAGVNATFLIDEMEFGRDGKRFLALACVTTENINLIRDHTNANLRQYLVDPYSPGRKKPLTKRGLHFSDAPEALREMYIALLPFLQFRGYIAFGELRGEEYRSLYMKLLSSLLPRRLKSYDRSTVTIYCEELTQITQPDLAQCVEAIYTQLKMRNERRPIVPPTCEVKGKIEEPAFSLPDSLLWIFARTFASTEPSEVDRLRFERLRDKYRHIVNTDTGETFSRRHPIEARTSLTNRSERSQ